MKTKTSLLILFVLSVALLSGCSVTTGSTSRAIRVTNEQRSSAESKMRQLQAELKLAEKRADLEKQRREFAEERLKKLQEKTDKPDKAEDNSDHGS